MNEDKDWVNGFSSFGRKQCRACLDPLNGRLKKLLKVINESGRVVPTSKIFERMCELHPEYGERNTSDSLMRHFRKGHEPLRKGNGGVVQSSVTK